MTNTITINGRAYVTHDSWTFGDYGGCGSYGLANIRTLLAECEGRVVECGFSDIRHMQENCPYGLGSDALAEITAERPWLIHAFGDYGSEQVWVRKPLDHIREWTKDCDNYPVMSEDTMSEIEMEWEEEAWGSWLKSDLIRTLTEDMQEAEPTDSELRDAYRSAMDDTNTYPEAEYSGVAVDVDRIAASFAGHVAEIISAR
jgi:hypothetical protein